MTEQEIAVKLEGHEHEISSLKYRTKELESQNKTMQDLAVSVKELAINMKNMLEEQKKQGTRISALEQEPGENWKSVKRTAVTAIVSTLSGSLVTTLIYFISQRI